MRILIAEDEFALRQLICGLLKRDGHICIEAECGREAIELSISELPDLILIDLNMPNVSGSEAIKTIRQIERLAAIPIICMSGISTEEMADLGLREEVNDWIAKPFGAQQLLEKVNKF